MAAVIHRRTLTLEGLEEHPVLRGEQVAPRIHHEGPKDEGGGGHHLAQEVEHLQAVRQAVQQVSREVARLGQAPSAASGT